MTPAGHRLARRLAGGAVAVVGALALAALSAAPVAVSPGTDARLRVAFSARPERVERCRTLSAEELADVPAHMRQSEVCEGTTARYRLEVLRDGRLLDSVTLRGGGIRHDRQLYALRELPVAAGPMTVEVRLTRLGNGGRPDTAASAAEGAETAEDHDRPGREEREHDERSGRDADDRPHREADERRRRTAAEVPAALVLRETLSLAPREVLLVTYDQGARRLKTVRGE